MRSTDGTVRVAVVDDHRLVRRGLRAVLEGISGVVVVGEGADGIEGVELARTAAPDIVFLDIAMPRVGGFVALERIRREAPESQVIILSMHANSEYVAKAFRAGASGYLLKDTDSEELSLAIRSVRDGLLFLSPRVARPVIEGFIGRRERSSQAELLTERQREVLRLMAQGRNTKSIAFLLQVSTKTVETHRANICRKLGVRDAASLVVKAVGMGLIPPEPGP